MNLKDRKWKQKDDQQHDDMSVKESRYLNWQGLRQQKD